VVIGIARWCPRCGQSLCIRNRVIGCTNCKYTERLPEDLLMREMGEPTLFDLEEYNVVDGKLFTDEVRTVQR
jgi:hypothetical protein